LTKLLHERAAKAWLESFSVDDLDVQERLNSIRSPEAGRPLNVVTAYRPNHMEDVEFIYYVRRRLLLPSTHKTLFCAETGREMDVHLDHAFCCTKRGMGATHFFVKKALLKVCEDLARYTGEKVQDEPSMADWVNPDAVANLNEKAANGLKQRRGDVGISQITIAGHLTRTVTILDVRHCSIKTPRVRSEIGQTTALGEKDKNDFYEKNFKIPPGVTVVPFVIDAYGKWGEAGKVWLEAYCKKAANTDVALYNRLINHARETISLTHARGVGNAISRCVEHCIPADDFNRACQRGA
jgi:hypothetical protein